MGFTTLKTGPKKLGGADTVHINGPTTTFGEVATADLFPIAQGDFVHGLNEQVFNTSSFAGSTVDTQNGMVELSSGTETSGSATVQLRRNLKYRAGQGSLMRGTALFDTPDAGNAQFIGAGSAECGYFIGYFGNNFGILHSETGAREVRKLEISSAVTTNADVTVTLDGESIVIPVTGSNSTTQTAYQLSLGDYTQLGRGGWLTDVVSSSVYFITARSTPLATGSYSVSGGGIAGAFSRTVEGQAQTNTFIPSSSFNIDPLDGTGPSGLDLDPQKGNVYQIGFQYLGFGNAKFQVEDPETGNLIKFHELKNANTRTTPVLKDPNVSILATSANIGGTTSKTLKSASMAAFVEGASFKLDPKYATSVAFSSLNSATYKPLLALKANRLIGEQSSFGEFDLLKIAASNESSSSTPRTLTVALFLNPKINGDVEFEYVKENDSLVSRAILDPSTNTFDNVANLVPFYELTVGAGGGVTEMLQVLDFVFGPGSCVVVGIKTTGGLAGAVSLNWYEQQ